MKKTEYATIRIFHAKDYFDIDVPMRLALRFFTASLHGSVSHVYSAMPYYLYKPKVDRVLEL